MGAHLQSSNKDQSKRKMRFLVSFAFLLAVASLVLSARLKRDTCDAGTIKDCIEAFDEYKFIETTDCKVDACDNCELCDGSFTGLCRYCIEGQDKCEENCREGKKNVLLVGRSSEEAAGLY